MRNRILGALLLTLAPAASAQTYIVSDRNCGAITLQATEGTDFPNLGGVIAPDRLESAYVYLQGTKTVVTPALAARSLDFSVNVPDEGLVVAAVTLEPTFSGDETRTEHAKAFVRCDGIARGEWRHKVGLGLEIIPQWNEGFPLERGHEMRFIAIDSATKEVIRDPSMELYRAGAGSLGRGVSDQHGVVSFKDRDPGRYLVTATYRRPDPQKPGYWLVDTTTLTFEIK